MMTLKKAKRYLALQAMNTDIVIHGTTCTSNWTEEIKQWFKDFEHHYSRFQPNNRLERFHQAKDFVVVEPELFDLVKDAIDYARYTDWYFNPFIRKRLEALGYDRSFEWVQDGWTNDNLDHFHPLPDEPYKFYPAIHAIEKLVTEPIDLGGIGKGWSVDRAAKMMKNNYDITEGMINAGGDLCIWGENEKNIGIADPFNENNDLAHCTLKNAAAATSNKVFRSWKGKNNIHLHHLLHGKTGVPADSDVVQATVFGHSAAECEVIAKVLCMLPFTKGISWLEEKFPTAACVLVNEDGRIAFSRTINHFVRKLELA
ncbi:FAD:protein FMN transferase [Bacillus tianshenii]|nr:FAD:protein FMN transferase [Bacillus tianshenii]